MPLFKMPYLDAFIALALAAIGAVSYLSVGPLNPLSLAQTTARSSSALLPEGWEFFTRDPHEEHIFVYRIEQGTVRNANGAELRGPGLFAGPSRAFRIRGRESAMLRREVPDAAWGQCRGSAQQCASMLEGSAPFHIQNRPAWRTLCGRVMLQITRIAPWAWSRNGRSPAMPSRAALVDVQCSL